MGAFCYVYIYSLFFDGWRVGIRRKLHRHLRCLD
nr:MAG TPA: hypothetical protein [Bacteriophage sp.]